MGELQVDTVHGRVALTRSGAGQPVLLLHGIPGSAASWRQVARLLEHHAEVLVPDLLGFGNSDRPADLATLHAQRQAQALADIVAALNIRSIAVVGHDFGGPVALLLTQQAPCVVNRLGLLATNAFPDTPVPMPLVMLTWPGLGRLAAPALFSRASLALMLRTGTGTPRPHLDRHAHLGDHRQSRAIRTVFEGSLRNLSKLYTPVQDQLQAWSGPAFVAWGDRDPFLSVEQGRRTADASGAHFLLLPDAGHFLPQERPDEVATQIAALLDTPLEVPATRTS